MDHSLKLLIAAVTVAATPLPALAQGWPATIVAGASQMAAPQPASALTVQRDMTVRRPRGVPQTRPGLQLRATLAVATAPDVESDEIPEVDLRAKDAWTDDQGLRVDGARLAFKRRF